MVAPERDLESSRLAPVDQATELIVTALSRLQP